MTQRSLEARTLQALVDEQQKLNAALQELLDQEAQETEERPLRELLEDLLKGRETDRELLSKLVSQQNEIIEFFKQLGTG